MNQGQTPAELVLLAVGTKTYRHRADFNPPLKNLDGVPDSLRRVVETLTGLGYKSALPETRDYLLDPGIRRLTESVREAAKLGPVVAVYYTGHGVKPDRDHYYLLTSRARPGDLRTTALEAPAFLDLVLRRDAQSEVLPYKEQPQVLVILDCCFSATGAIEALTKSLQGIGNPNVWVLATARSLQYAREGQFAAALSQALLDPDVGSSQELLNLDWVIGNINKTLEHVGQEAGWVAPGGFSTGKSPFFPNPKHDPNGAGLTIAQQHWLTRLRSTATEGIAAEWYVTGGTGRVKVVQDLAKWMRQGNGLAVVTGSPGCGKSAMLELPVLLTDDQRRDALTTGAAPDSLVTYAADLFAGLPVHGIYALGKTPYQVAEEIAEYIGLSVDSPNDLLAELQEHPKTALTIVVDAADEIRDRESDPSKLFSELLLPLAALGLPGLRVIVGARRHAIPKNAKPDLLIDLDSASYRDPEALAKYAYQLLTADHPPGVASPYRDHDDIAGKAAKGIAAKATGSDTATGQGESFLLAQLLARTVRSRKQVLDVEPADWADDQLPADVGEAFDEDLGYLGEEPATRALMTALAWAKGPGLPWEGIWVPVAQALANQTGTGMLQLKRRDVKWLLDNAPAYVIEDVGPGGRSVFRLLHDLLAAHLRGQSAPDWEHRRPEAEKAIYKALLDTVPGDGNTLQDWEGAHPYLLTYLAQHAAAAGTPTLVTLANKEHFLAVADPVMLSSLLSPAIPELRPAARTYRHARPMLGEDARANTRYLQEAKQALGSISAAFEGNVRSLLPSRTHLKSAHRDDSVHVFTGHRGPVNSVAFGITARGQWLLASADDDQMIGLWDPITDAAAGDPLFGHSDGVSSVAFGRTANGEPLLASASWDGTVRLWNPINGTPIGDPLRGHSGGVSSVAFGRTANGEPLLASAGDDQKVWLWNPVNSARIGELLSSGQVSSVAFGRTANGEPLLASAGDDRTVRLWDPTDSAPIGDPLHGHSGGVSSVAFGRTANGEPLLASASWDGTVRLWDPTDSAPIGDPLHGHSGGVSSVAFGRTANGEPLLASASWDGTVRLWDPTDSAPIGDPLHGHSGGVSSVAFGRTANGEPLLASAGDDRTVRLWDPLSGTLARQGAWASSLTDRTMATEELQFASAS